MGYPSQTQSNRIQGVLMVILATIFWGTSGIFISLTNQNWDISAVSLAFWRDITTFSTLLLGIAIFRPALLRVKRKDIPWLMAMGAISIGSFHVLWNTSVFLIGASVSTVLQSNAPIFVTIMAWIIFKEPLTMRKIVAVALAVAGTVLISGILGMSMIQIPQLGLIASVSSAIFYGSFSLFGKKLTGDYNPWTILLYIFGFAALTLLPFQLLNPSPFPYQFPALFYFSGLILIATIIGFAIYTTALAHLQASIASITATSEIVFAAVYAYFVLSERMDIWQILGAVLVVSGVVLVSLPNGNKKAKLAKQSTAWN
ncbi:MAG: DMT family transporter [Anaerolineales bacterium]